MLTSKRWTLKQVKKLFEKPFLDLIFEAQKIHRKYFKPNEIQISTLISIKTGACPEDCKYCPQSSRYKTNIEKERLIQVKKVIESAKKAKKTGSTRFCMGAAWKNPSDRDIPILEKMIYSVKKIGMETCMTLGMINNEQAKRLAKAGLDFYNHNLDTSPNFYKNIVSTRKYQERIDTLNVIRNAGIKICSGGIIGLGENIQDRAELLIQLANLPVPPESVPINMLVKIPGTPLSNNKDVEPFDFIKTIAVARIIMPNSHVRLSAGREKMNEQTQVLCFMAGANSIFYGCQLLTTSNPSEENDVSLFNKLGINIEHVNKNVSNKNINEKINFDTSKYYNASL